MIALDIVLEAGYTGIRMKDKAMIKATKTTAQQIRDYAKGWADMRMVQYMSQYDHDPRGIWHRSGACDGGDQIRVLAKLMGWPLKAVKEVCLEELLEAYVKMRKERQQYLNRSMPSEMPLAEAKKLLADSWTPMDAPLIS